MNTWLDDGDVRLYHGNADAVLDELPERSVQCVVTSPPYYGLRDYGSDEQIGLELTPTAYVDRLVSVFRSVHRVLRDDGIAWLNLGDSYANDTKWGGSSGGKHVEALHGATGIGRGRTTTGLKAKDLVGIPWRVAFALQADGWYLRSEIVWSKPNPMPEPVTDRPTKAHEQVFLLAKQPKYFFDADAIREPHQWEHVGATRLGARSKNGGSVEAPVDGKGNTTGSFRAFAEGGRNARSVWEIATQPTPEAHFATFPEALVRRCIAAGTSDHAECAECGTPWRRVVEARSMDRNELPRDHPEWRPRRYDDGKAGDPQAPGPGQRFHESRTLGWEPACECGKKGHRRPQTVLDPFVGSGTTALVARKMGRHAIGIDLNESYLGIAARRLGQQSLFA